MISQLIDKDYFWILEKKILGVKEISPKTRDLWDIENCWWYKNAVGLFLSNLIFTKCSYSYVVILS